MKMKEGQIRKWLEEERYINAVIGLPDKLFLNTDIPVCIVVLQAHSENVYFIDSSGEFEKKSKKNDMTEEQISKVVDAYGSREEIERYANVVEHEEIKENDYNLNIPRYVDTHEPEPLPDIDEILAEMEQIDEEIKKCEKELCDILGDLRGGVEDQKSIERFRNLLRKG